MIAAALTRAPGERDQGAERREVTGPVVAGLGRHQGWMLRAALPYGQAGRALPELLPARPIAPRPDRTVAVDRDVDQTRVAPRELLHSEAAPLRRTGPVPLHEDVGVRGQAEQLIGIDWRVQVQIRRELARVGRQDVRRHA